MRILHIDTGKEMRGGQYQLLLLHDTLAERSWDQGLLAGAGIRARRPAEAATWTAVRRRARGCDLIHAHDARAHTLAAVHGAGKPIVVARRVAFSIGTGAASRWKYRRADHYIAISRHVAGVLREGGVPEARISVVHDAAPSPDTLPEGRSPVLEPRGDPAPEFRVVSPDFDDPLKCRDLAVAACSQAGIDLVLSADLVRDLPSADAFLYLSRSEGLGSALLLAMTLGVPAVASAVGGMPEVVSDGKSGLLVENRIDSIVAALERLRADRALRRRLAEAGRLRARSAFARERMADKTVEVYRRVLDRPRRTAGGD